MTDQNTATRLKVFIDSLGISNSQFADECGIARPSLSQLLTGRNKKISSTIVEAIHEHYPRLSVVWLMFGEGEMLVKSPSEAAAAAGGGADELDANIVKDTEDSVPYGSRSIYAPNEERIYTAGGVSLLNPQNSCSMTVIEMQKELKQLRKQLEDEKKQKRRVSHITVYYDDSTFETFFPEGR